MELLFLPVLPSVRGSCHLPSQPVVLTMLHAPGHLNAIWMGHIEGGKDGQETKARSQKLECNTVSASNGTRCGWQRLDGTLSPMAIAVMRPVTVTVSARRRCQCLSAFYAFCSVGLTLMLPTADTLCIHVGPRAFCHLQEKLLSSANDGSLSELARATATPGDEPDVAILYRL